MKNTGFGVSEYSFVIPEVGMSGKGSILHWESDGRVVRMWVPILARVGCIA